MKDQRRETRLPRGGRHWLLTAVATPLIPLIFGIAALQDNAWNACLTRYGSPAAPTQGPCATSYSLAAVLTLAFWVLALAAGVTGILIGTDDGRGRRRFVHGRWASMTVIGLCAPWMLLAYTLGYVLARLLPVRRPRLLQEARDGGWQQAVQLYARLARGQQPPAVFAPDLQAGTVYMDVPFSYSRFYAMNVTYRPGGMVAVGSPGFVAGAAIGRLIDTTIGYAQAASLSRRQWREHRPSRVVVTATATWCAVHGRWLAFDHTAVVTYRVDADQSCVLTLPDLAPVRLHGPSAWCHAVLFAYLRDGPAAWQSAPFLHPVRDAARRLTSASR